jgi:predicted N-formylglutamate amidohydrolase
LAHAEKQKIIAHYYAPYRAQVESFIGKQIEAGYTVVHLAAHSFTPVYAGATRNADLGLLYDSRRIRESRFAHRCKLEIHERLPALKVRCNYPYLGKSDGLTTHLRRTFSEREYLGLEIEINQRLLEDATAGWPRLQAQLAAAIRAALSN